MTYMPAEFYTHPITRARIRCDAATSVALDSWPHAPGWCNFAPTRSGPPATGDPPLARPAVSGPFPRRSREENSDAVPRREVSLGARRSSSAKRNSCTSSKAEIRETLVAEPIGQWNAVEGLEISGRGLVRRYG